MRTRRPTAQETEQLISFLPVLYAEGFSPIIKWTGGSKNNAGAFIVPYPEYDRKIYDFIKVASSEYWDDYDYNPEIAGRMLEDEETIKTADIDMIKTMLTYCVRGERFCSGHWGAMVSDGVIRRLLQRLSDLR
ncbi:MAG: hypothetical protein JXR48_15225 [Candidatus Delongbacteria bacterium]|nr:hypothetical protein [Candidatus Delongbacteria bacterium]